MNNGGVYVQHAAICPTIIGVFSRKRRYYSHSPSHSSSRLPLPAPVVGRRFPALPSIAFRRRPPFEATAVPKSNKFLLDPKGRKRMANYLAQFQTIKSTCAHLVIVVRDLGIVESEHRRIKWTESYCTRKE
ncbi:hypothetical protein GQ457_06G017020 [Hibiscus cannabinus]